MFSQRPADRMLRVLAALLAFSTAHAADITASRQTAASKQARAGEAEFRALYKELVEINTTLSVGSCTDASNAMKARLSAAGYADEQLHVIVPPGLAEGRQPRRACCRAATKAQAHPAARAYRRGRGQPRRLGARSVQARRRRWILLRARRVRRQGHGGGVRRLDGALQAGEATGRSAPSSLR